MGNSERRFTGAGLKIVAGRMALRAAASATAIGCGAGLFVAPPPVAAQQAKPTPSIATFTREFDLKEGFFDLYVDPKTGKTYLLVEQERLGQEFISFTYTENGAGAGGHFRGAYRDNRILAFERQFNALRLVNRNTRFYFDPQKAISRAAEANVTDAVLAALPIVAADETPEATRFLVSADEIFLDEALHALSSGVDGEIAKDRTTYEAIRNYPENTNVVVEYVFANKRPTVSADAVTDPRSVSIKLQHSLIAMPDNGFEPLVDDYRVGFFTERVTDLTSERAAPYRDLVTRWRLVKKDPDATLSDPVQPIVWWIENTTPEEYRDVIARAALAWNSSFEAAGFTNAIEVKVQPDDAEWDAGDIRYNVLRWTSSPTPLFGGYGPSFTNPRTGEILGADVMLEYAFITNRMVVDEVFPAQATGISANAAGDYFAIQTASVDRATGTGADDAGGAPEGAAGRLLNWVSARLPGGGERNLDDRGPEAARTGDADGRKVGNITAAARVPAVDAATVASVSFSTEDLASHPLAADYQAAAPLASSKDMCRFANHFSTQLAFGRSAVAAGGDAAAASRLVEESLYFLVLHEVGHTLGLNHNMKASSFHGPRAVHDAAVTRGAPSASVMDYPAINIAPPGVAQGDFVNSRPGPYDDWAIEFGYQPSHADASADASRRRAILARAAKPENAFGNDADDMRTPGRGVDPRVMIGDMSSDPVAYAVDRFAAVDVALAGMIERYADEESWQELLRQYAAAYAQRETMAGVIARQVGGVYVERRAPDQFSGDAPYTPVPIDRQKAAVAALGEHVFAAGALRTPAEILIRLQPQRRGFDFFAAGNEDPKVQDLTLAIQDTALMQLLHPATMKRLTDSAAYGNEYEARELLLDLNEEIFGADLMGRPDAFRQNLQIRYLLRLRMILGLFQYDTTSKNAALEAVADVKARMGMLDFWLPAETRAHRKHVALLLQGI